MHRRVLFLAAALLAFGLGNFEARAGFVPIPTTLDQLTPSGSYTTVAGPETLTFSNFSYSSVVLPASSINVLPFTLAGPPPETGITFTGGFYAAPGTIADYSIFYTVTAPAGESLTDAYLAITAGNFNGTGAVSVTDTFTNPTTGALVGSVEASLALKVNTTTFPDQQSIRVEKDIILVGGSNGATVSIIDQGYSSTSVIPEPTSMALLGIGMAGFFTYRRFFKRAATV